MKKKQTIRLDQIGVAILSTNRVECTKRLLDSIEEKTPTNGWRNAPVSQRSSKPCQ